MQSFLKRAVQFGYGASLGLRNLTIAFGLLVLPAQSQTPAAEPTTIVALGDSLTAGYGLNEGEGLVPQLQNWLVAAGQNVVVENAGVSGDTTAGGRARLDWALGPDTDAVIVTLGGNDMLRGVPAAEVRANLEAILAELHSRNLPVLLVAMKAPLNWGPDYKAAFDAAYGELASQYDAALFPDIFQGLIAEGADPSDPGSMARFMQGDAIHPNAEGVRLIVAALGPEVIKLLQSRSAPKAP